MTDFHRFDPQIQSEDISYRHDELITCECGRQNAPNRAACIYCGRAIATGKGEIPSSDQLEAWETGFNAVVISPHSNAAAEMFEGQSPEPLSCAVPLARYSSLAEAELAAERIGGRVISDESLRLHEPPLRLSGIEVEDTCLVLIDFNTRSHTEIDRSDLALVVAGVLVKTRSESVEQRKRKSLKVIDESEIESRELVLDIYSRSDSRGYRVMSTGFDFSVLGPRKGLLVDNNFASLIEFLKAFHQGLKVVEDYNHARRILDGVWPVEVRTDVLGERKIGIRKSGFARAATTSNLEQFNRFSRLQWHVL